MSRLQRNDANVVKGLSFVSLVNSLSGTGKTCIFKTFGSVDSKLSIARYFYQCGFGSIFGSCG